MTSSSSMLMTVHRAYRQKLESDPALFDLLIEALEGDRPVARRHRARVQSEVQRVVEEGIASGAFAMNDRRRAMSLIFDAAHRFIHPLALSSTGRSPARRWRRASRRSSA